MQFIGPKWPHHRFFRSNSNGRRSNNVEVKFLEITNRFTLNVHIYSVMVVDLLCHVWPTGRSFDFHCKSKKSSLLWCWFLNFFFYHVVEIYSNKISCGGQTWDMFLFVTRYMHVRCVDAYGDVCGLRLRWTYGKNHFVVLVRELFSWPCGWDFF